MLETSGPDPVVQQKLASLLARRGQAEAALAAFHAAADGHLAAGFTDRALAVCTEAKHWFPTSYGLWERIAELHLAAGRRADAAHTFLEARSRLRGKVLRPQAMLCLARALEIEPGRPEPTIALARLCAKEGQRGRAEKLLDDLERTAGASWNRPIAWARLRLSPTPARLWRWLFPASGR